MSDNGDNSSIAAATTWTSMYAQQRQDARRQLERLETELSVRLTSADTTFRTIDREKKFKEVRQRELQKQMEKIKVNCNWVSN